MKTQTNKTQEPQNSITLRVTSESSNGGTAQLKDDRTSSISQRKLRSGMDSADNSNNPIQRKNNTGLPDNLKSGIENLSGYSMDDVKVHYNSSKPAQLQAHAYAQGTDIHLAPGQEKHLPHEAWHVVQQKQGRVKPTRQLKSKLNINDDVALEKEADVMGERALRETSTDRTLRMSDGLNNGEIFQQRSTKEPNANIKLGKEQPIQAKWVRNKTTGEIRNYVDDEQINEETHEILEDRFMKSGDELRFGPNYNIDPDVVGGENGVTEIPEEFQRPDDVERHIPYRAAIHKLQDMYFYLDEIKKARFLPGILNRKILRYQDRAKVYAKDFKKDKRDLGEQNKSLAKQTYVKKMDDLTVEINEDFQFYVDNGYVMEDQDFVESKNIWRERWKAILGVVEDVLKMLWPRWRNILKETVGGFEGYDRNTVQQENWQLSFGGSLGKGYKGPPKQNVRFITTRFDVDANMDADSLANYLLITKDRKVDRGTIKVEDADDETRVKEMDAEMDAGIKGELVAKELATEETVETMVSEPFETIINTSESKLHGTALDEWTRSDREQKLRDKITRLNGTNPGKIGDFVSKIERAEELRDLLVYNVEEDRYFLYRELLTMDQIVALEGLLEKSKSRGFLSNLCCIR